MDRQITLRDLSLQQKELIKPEERVDYLLREKRYIIQNPHYFPFSLDAVLLADFTRLPKGKKVKILDFCCGGGIIPLLLSARTAACIEGVELQAEIAEMAQRSVCLNQLEDQVMIYQGDLKEIPILSPAYDVITCNPPFFTLDEAHSLHANPYHAIARHELALTLNEWVSKASSLLKYKGRLFVVYRPNRLDDLMETLLDYQFAIHRLRFVYPKIGVNANSVLVEAINRGGRQGVRIEPGLVVHESDGSYSKAMQAIYYGVGSNDE